MKRILSLLLLLAVSLNVWAAVSWSDSQFTYTQIGTTNEVMIKVKSGVTFGGENKTVPNTVSYGGKLYYITEIEDKGFWEQKTLKSFIVPSGIKKIGEWAFSCCSELESVDMSNTPNLKEIDRRAFAICDKLKQIYIPASVTTIGEAITYGDDALQTITVSSANQYYSTADNVLYNKNKTRLMLLPSSKTGTFTLPNTVLTIDEYAFQDSHLDKVVFNEGLTSIPDNVGYNSYIKEVDFPSTMKRIHYLSFSMNYSLTDLYFASATPPIFESASHDDKNEFDAIEDRLSNIAMHVPYSAMSTYKNYAPLAGARAYYAYDGAHDSWTRFTYTSDGVELKYDYSKVNGCSFVAQSQTTTAANVKVPYYAKYNNANSFVYGMRYGAFQNLKTLKSIESSVREIGPLCFLGCTNLKSAKLDQLTRIQRQAFQNSGLESFVFQSNTEVLNDAFYGCSRLHFFNMFTSNPPVTNGYSLRGVDRNIKIFVTSSTNYKAATEWSEFRGYKTKYSNLVLTDPNYIYTYYDASKTATFNGFKSFPDNPDISVSIPRTITKDGVSYEVTSISSYAFAATPELNKLDCEATLSSIGERAFYNSKIKKVTLLNNPSTVPSYGSECINTSKVPSGFCFEVFKSMLSTFQSASGWSGIKQYIKPCVVQFTFRDCTFEYDPYEGNGSILSADLVRCNSTLASLELTDPNYRIPETNLLFKISNIAGDAFKNSTVESLDLYLPYLRSIGTRAFGNMSKLSTFRLSNAGTVTSLPEECFIHDTQLAELLLPTSMDFGTKCCYNCASLHVLDWDNVASIGYAAFSHSGLTRVKINSSIDNVSMPAFSDMQNLKTLVIEGTTTFNNEDFSYCPNLKDIVCLSSTAPALVATTKMLFSDKRYNLHVRLGKTSAYSNAEGWKNMNITEDGDFLQSDNIAYTTPVRINSASSAESDIIFSIKTGERGWVRRAEFDIALPEGVTVKTTNGVPVFQNLRNSYVMVTATMNDSYVHCTVDYGSTSNTAGNSDLQYLKLTVKGTDTTGDKLLRIRNLKLTNAYGFKMEKVADVGSMLYCYPKVWGDMNMDGKFNVADLVTLEGYLNGKQGIRVSPDSKEILSGGDYNSTSLLQMRNKLLGK